MTVVNVTPPVLSGIFREGRTVTTSNGTWTSDDPLSFAYQWRRCDAAGANCVDIVGATSNSYTIVQADVGARLRSRVTATENPAPPDPGVLLRFEPPGAPTSYAGYTTLNILDSGSNRYQILNDSVDYIVNIDDYVFTEGPTLIGGRNVVIVGGRITINASSDPDPFGLALWPRGGAKYYLEGLRIRPGTGNSHLHDGIVVRHNGTYPSTSASRIVLQNCRVGPCSIKPGLTDSAHSDIIQFQSAYPGELWTDMFTGLGDYNGLMYSNHLVKLCDYHRMNLRGVDVHPSYAWHLGFYQGIASSLIQFDDFWIEPGPGRTLGNSMYPGTAGRNASPSDSVSAGTISMDAISQYIAWSPASGLTGIVRKGPPPSGDFVEDADCGVGYVTPGYL